MLRRTTLTSAQQRELRRWQTHGDPRRARPARLVLWSARGWSVPALARACGGCRRTVRRGRHAFRAAGLAGRHSDPSGRASRRGNGARSATAPGDAPCEGRRLPVVPLAVPAVRRLLAVQWFRHAVSPDHVWPWSTWRRYKQALAKRSHYKKRGATPPEFEQVRLEYQSLICHVGSAKGKVLTREPSAARPVWTAWTCGGESRCSQGRSRQVQT